MDESLFICGKQNDPTGIDIFAAQQMRSAVQLWLLNRQNK